MVTGLVLVAAVLAAASVVGLRRLRRDGRLRESPGQRLTEADLGGPLGKRGTLLQFSSSFCAPCRATRQLLADVANRSEDVTHIDIDVAARLDLTRRLDIRRTPTVLVLGPHGQIKRRASGLPRRSDVVEALALATGDGRR